MNTCMGNKGISSDCSEDDKFFTRERTLKLLELYKTYRKRLGSFEVKNMKKLWEVIARELSNHYRITIASSKCENRFRVLERDYKKVRDNNNKTGRGTKLFEYENEMNDIFEKNRNVNPTLFLSSSKSYQTDTLETSSVQISIPEESQSITSCSFEASEPNTVQDSENRVKANTNNMPTAKITLKKKSQPVKLAYQKRNSILLELTNNVKSFYENNERRDAEKLELQRRKIANQEERTALAREYLELVKQSSTQCSNEDAEICTIYRPVD